MPEPITVTAPPEQHDPAVAVSTGDWKGTAPAADAAQPDNPTVTKTVASTPGPGHPERRTASDQTERLGPVPGDRPALPDISGFRVEEEIGHGGMGVVYRAVQLEMAKTVALKVIYPRGRDRETVRIRFAREVQALARIEHPNVVPIYHAGDWHGFPYFTMKFVPGGSLNRHLGRFTGDTKACTALMAKVARAVQVLHDHKVIHRDLKPLNILIGEEDEPLVADFGLAKWLDEEPSAAEDGYPVSFTGIPMGTKQYMAPEQTRGETTDRPEGCDIWAIGVTLYELLAGVRPFPDDGSSDLLQRICEVAPPPLPNTVPPELASVVWKCLGKRPEERYATASTIADDLEKWLAGEPVSVPVMAAPPGNPPRRRSRWLVTTALLGLVALIALPASLFPNRPPRPEKPIAERLRDREIVWLIREKEEPQVLAMPGGRVGTLSMDRRGYWAVGSADSALIELAVGQGMPPFILEAEVAPLSGNELSRFGVYTGRQSWRAADGEHQALFAIKVNAPADKKWPFEFPPGMAEAQAIHVTPTAPYLRTMAIVPGHEYNPPAIVLNAEPNWHRIRVQVTPDEYSVTVLGEDHSRITTPLAAKQVEHILRGVPGAPPVIGPLDGGIGLLVSNGKVLYRNVRIMPAN